MGVFFLFLGCFCILLLLPVTSYLLTYIFRLSCVLCGLPKPGIAISLGKLFMAWVAIGIAVAVLRLVVLSGCKAAGVPQWEAGPATWLLALPIDLVLSSSIHAGIARIRFGKAVEVWFVQRLILLSIVVAILFIVALVMLVSMLAG